MKKTSLFYGILIFIPVLAIIMTSFSNGGSSGNGVTGSPLDNQLAPASCLTCHSNDGNYNTSVTITSNIPSGGYALGQTYNITVTQSSVGASVHGFQITVEDSAPNKLGGFGITDDVNTHLQAGTNFVTHSFAGTSQNSWNFTWKAPLTDVGAITFYVASIAGNLNGSNGVTTNNNQMAQSTLVIGSVLAINHSQLLQFSMFPNPSDGVLNFQLPSNTQRTNVSIFDYLGKTLIQKDLNASNSTIDVSSLSSGIYFVRINTNTKTGTKKLIIR